VPDYFTADEAADYLRVSRRSFYRLGISRVQVSDRLPRWRKCDIDQWCQERLDAAAISHPKSVAKSTDASLRDNGSSRRPSGNWDWLTRKTRD
jgi:predicted DNA-binding transcriptional regulator AlpA